MIVILILAIEKGKILETIPNLHKLYKVSVKIIPRGVKPGWTGALQATIGRTGTYGQRCPAMFFEDMSTKLHVCGAMYYPDPFGCITLSDHPLPLNKETLVEVQQIPGFSQNNFIVKLDGVERWRTHPNYVTTFHNVNIYEANPWQSAANVDLKDYRFDSGVTKGHLVEQFDDLEAFYTMQLKVLLYDTSPTLTNILHASFHSNGQQFGDRIPMLNIKPGSTVLEVYFLHSLSCHFLLQNKYPENMYQ